VYAVYFFTQSDFLLTKEKKNQFGKKFEKRTSSVFNLNPLPSSACTE